MNLGHDLRPYLGHDAAETCGSVDARASKRQDIANTLLCPICSLGISFDSGGSPCGHFYSNHVHHVVWWVPIWISTWDGRGWNRSSRLKTEHKTNRDTTQELAGMMYAYWGENATKCDSREARSVIVELSWQLSHNYFSSLFETATL